MLKVGVIGIGNTGNQIAALAMKELKIPVLALNSSEKDLETIPTEVPRYAFNDENNESRGAGKDRGIAKNYIKNSILKFLSKDEYNNFINELDVVFVISSTGGGTGSGAAPIMVDIIRQRFVEVKVIPIGVLPVRNEAISSHRNTLEYLNELYTTLDNVTYMLYDNDKLSNLPSYQMMQKVNMEVVKDIDVIRCSHNYSTKYDSIDENDINHLISFPGRIVIARLEDIKEKDCEGTTIEDMLIDKIRTNCHVESQRDKKVIASGIITNLSENLTESFDNHIPKVREFVGDPIHDFSHTYINEDRKLPNNVYLILSGLTPINDKIHKLNDRVDEINDRQAEIEEENAINEIDLSSLNSKISSTEKKNKNVKPTDPNSSLDLRDIFEKFGI